MANVEIKITGVRELITRLQTELPAKLKSTARAALREGAKVVQEQIKANAPTATGVDPDAPPYVLRDSIDIQTSARGEDSGKWRAYVGVAGRRVYPKIIGTASRMKRDGKRVIANLHRRVATVARYLEFGTSKMMAQPFMRPAFESTKDRAYAAITARLKKALGIK